MTVEKNKPLKGFNTFGINAFADYFIQLDSFENITDILDEFENQKLLILGGGSNILFLNDFNGLVLLIENKGIKVVYEDEQEIILKVAAGENWHSFVMYCVERNFGGLENLSLIPGKVGAAPMQNIGAYGVDVKDSIETVYAYDLESRKEIQLANAACDFGYRDSIFKKALKGKVIIESVSFRLQKSPVLHLDYGAIQNVLKEKQITAPTIQDVSQAVIDIRQSKLPDPKIIGNAGSFFKNPEIPHEDYLILKSKYTDLVAYPTTNQQMKLAAGWLIEQAGWKGKKINDIGVHTLQSLVLVNYGGGKGSDIANLARNIQESILEKFNISLETEVNFV